MEKRKFQPESLMMSHGYIPALSEGAIKCPIFQTSTFVFNSAQEGKAFFEVAYGLREKKADEELGLIYSRLNNPDLEILEERLCLWDEAEEAAVFESGMSAISTTLMEFLNPGDLLLYGEPLYGGTIHFITEVLTRFGIEVIGFHPWQTKEDIAEVLINSGKANKLAMIYLETPANPTNELIDIAVMRELADRFSRDDKRVLVGVDNTYLGPLFQHPLKHGADLILYSATKYIGGHSDVIAGVCLGSKELIARVKTLRTFLGSMAGPWTAWLLMRSLETLKARMELQASNAMKVARFLHEHPKVEKVHYLGLKEEMEDSQQEIYKKQCLGPGAMVSFNIVGSEKEAFAFMNNLKLFKLAVSLGSTESLVQHPFTMTHAGIPKDELEGMGITDKLVRLSIGVENSDDLVWAIKQAFEKVPVSNELEV